MSRVEGLHARLVVAVERRDRGRGTGADVVVGGVSEPHADLVEIDAHALAVDDRARERLVDDQVELVVRVAVLVGVMSPMYSAAPNGAPAVSRKKIV